MNPYPLPPTELPGLRPLIAGDLWKRWAEQRSVFPLESFRKSVGYMRLKPSTSCRMTVFDGPSAKPTEPPPAFLLHLYTDSDRAREAYGKLSDRPQMIGGVGYRPFLNDELAVVASPYPNDIELPALRHFYRLYRLKQALYEALTEFPQHRWAISKRSMRMELLAYKPGRRAVYRVDLTLRRLMGSQTRQLSLHVKVENADDYGRGFERLSAIHAAMPEAASWSVPRPIGKADERCIAVTEWVDGLPLLSQLDRPHTPDALRSIGRSLAQLHDLPAVLGRSTSPLEPVNLRQLGLDLSALLPEEADRIAKLSERLALLMTELVRESSPVPVHGDFHLGQVLLRDTEPVLVDLDLAGAGVRSWDIGSFLANLREITADVDLSRVFLAGYVDGTSSIPGPSELAVAEAAALFRRAILPFRCLDDEWPERIRGRLGQIERLIEEAGL